MKYSWRKAVAFVVALTLVAGYAMPANVDTGGFFGGTTIIAHAADEVSENISLVAIQTANLSTISGTHYSVSCGYMVADDKGMRVNSFGALTINARKGETISKVILSYSEGGNRNTLSASIGTFDGNSTITGINAQQVSISSTSTTGVIISAVTVYFEGSLSNPTVTLTGGANAKSSGGLLTQSYLPGAMDTVTYTALTGATFPEFETYMLNGVTVERTSDTVVTISGTPTANTAIIVPDAVSSSKIVTWNSATISSISSNIANDYTYTANGITFNKTGKGKFANNEILGYDSTASFVFTTATGKFTNIEIAASAINNGGNWTTVGNTLKWNGTPSNSVSLSGSGLYLEGVSSINFVIEMPADLSNATVTLGADNTVSSVTVGGNEITNLSEFDITYGTDESHTATEPPTEDGTYYAYVTAKTESENYTGTAKSEAFTVVNTITLNSENVTIADFTYDGTEKTPVLKYGDTALVKDTDYELVTTEGDTASATNAGTYTIHINGKGDYAGENIALTWKINKKAVTITAGSASKTYDGSALTNSGFTASDLETGDTHTFTVAMSESSTITNAGTQDNVIATVDGVAVTAGTATAVGNYSVTAANGTLTVNRKAVTITADSDSKTYDGTPLTKNSFTASALEAGDMHSFNVVMSEGSTITNAGTQANVIATVDGVAVTAGTATAVGNYSVTAANGTLTVNKADSLVAAPTAKNPVRENSPVQLINAGEAQTGCKIEYALGTDATTAPTSGWETDATKITANQTGTFYVWYKVTGDDVNYADAAPKCLTVKVTQAKTWTLSMPDYIYDGTAHEPTIKGTTFGKLTYTYFTSAGICIGTTAPTEPGDYRVSVAASGDNTYPSKLESVEYTIKGAKFAAGNTVSFKEKVEFNFLVEATDAETVEGAYVVFTYDHYGEKMTVKKPINKDDMNGKYYRVRLPLTASEMAIDIKAELYLPTLDKPVDTKTRSIKDYAESAIKSNLDGAEVLKAMLNYGGYTQTALGNNTTLLANSGEGIAVDVSSVAPKSATPFVRPTATEGAKVTYKGSTAMTTSDLYVRHYFTVDSSMTASELNAIMVKVGDNAPISMSKLKKNNIGYYCEMSPELAYELDRENGSVVVYGFAGAETADSENAISIENYNVIDYCEAVAGSNKQTTDAKNMAKAMYSYYTAAKAYVDSRA